MDVTLADNFVENLEALLRRKRINQRDLARLSGVHFVTINHILNRKMTPSLGVCSKIVEALGVAPEKFFRETSQSA